MTLAQGITIDGSYILLVLGGSGTVIALLFRLLIASKDREFALKEKEANRAYAEMESLKKSYAEIASDAVRSELAVVNDYRAREGKPPLIAELAPVVPESHSLPSNLQKDQANISTLRAQMEVIKSATGQPARINTFEGPISPAPNEDVKTAVSRTADATVVAAKAAIDAVNSTEKSND